MPQRSQHPRNRVRLVTQIHADIQRHLIVTAAAGMQTLADIADPGNQDGFNVHMNILGVNHKLDLAVLDIAPDFAQRFYDQFRIGLGDNPLPPQHLGMCLAAQNVLPVHARVKADGRIKIIHQCICGL